jgi:hypothetical protein
MKQRDGCHALLASDSRVVRGISVSGIQIGWLNSSQELRIEPSVPKTRVRMTLTTFTAPPAARSHQLNSHSRPA